MPPKAIRTKDFTDARERAVHQYVNINRLHQCISKPLVHRLPTAVTFTPKVLQNRWYSCKDTLQTKPCCCWNVVKKNQKRQTKTDILHHLLTRCPKYISLIDSCWNWLKKGYIPIESQLVIIEQRKRSWRRVWFHSRAIYTVYTWAYDDYMCYSG